MKVTVEIPEVIAEAARKAGVDPARKVLEDTVAQAYREGLLTQWELQQALGMQTRFEVDPFLGKYQVYDYTLEEAEKDLAASAILRARRNKEAA